MQRAVAPGSTPEAFRQTATAAKTLALLVFFYRTIRQGREGNARYDQIKKPQRVAACFRRVSESRMVDTTSDLAGG